ARRSPSCSPRSTSSPPCCGAPSSTSITSTSKSGSSGWARSCARRRPRSRSSRTSCSTDDRAPRRPSHRGVRRRVVRTPPRAVHALLHGDVGAVQLLRDEGVPHLLHDRVADGGWFGVRPQARHAHFRRLYEQRLGGIDRGRTHRRLAARAVQERPRRRDLDRAGPLRSEEHTSELQSRGQLVCRLLLEKKKRKNMSAVKQYDKE